MIVGVLIIIITKYLLKMGFERGGRGGRGGDRGGRGGMRGGRGGF